MNQILSLAFKDIKLLIRDRIGAFFIFGFPILMGVFFGVIMGGGLSKGANANKIKLAVVDLDQSEQSKKFQSLLSDNTDLQISETDQETAPTLVRKSKVVGFLIIPQGFGKTAGVLWEEQPEMQLGTDPSKAASGAMLEGMVMQAMGEMIGDRFGDTDMMKQSIKNSLEDIKNDKSIDPITKVLAAGMFGQMDRLMDSIGKLNQKRSESGDGEKGFVGQDIQFANIKKVDIRKEDNGIKLKSQYDISFPQGMLWGILGCAAGFSISIARERSQGTLVRLQAAPIQSWQILIGKALACFLVSLSVFLLLTILGYLLGMKVDDYLKLAVTAVCTAFCFVGIMMSMAVLGKTEESVSGAGWAINMVMAMLGGAMVPYMFFPPILQTIGMASPVKWSIDALEGSIWRDFTWVEMTLPLMVLLGFGIAGFAFGSFRLHQQLKTG